MAFRIKTITAIRCPYDGCYYSINSASDGTDQAVVNIMCYHYATHLEPIDDEADCG